MKSTLISKLIKDEKKRQNEGLELIASENYPSKAVREACGSILMDKYAEGYPGKRYYGGCEVVDKVEQYAIDKVCELFGCKHANVQPHSGSQANMGMYRAIYKILGIKDRKLKILATSLSDAAHLTHGSPVNFSSEYCEFVTYPLIDGRIDLEVLESALKTEHPDVLLTGFSAYPYIIPFAEMSHLAEDYNAMFVADIAHIAGLVAAGAHPSPFPWCDIVTTTTHKTLRGPRGGMILWNDDSYSAAINSAIFPWCQGGPNEAIIAGKAVMAEEALSPEFGDYIRRLRDNMFTAAGYLRTKLYFPCYSDNHLMLINTKAEYGITGKEAEQKLAEIGISVNKNMIPGDTEPPSRTSGIRVGLAALTTRGIQPPQVRRLFKCIHYYLSGEIPQEEAKAVVKEIAKTLKRIEKL